MNQIKLKKISVYFELMRPFTLIMPVFGIIAGGLVALLSSEKIITMGIFGSILVAAFCASVLNGASNSLNQIYDIDIDKINKPNRPLPEKRLSIKNAQICVFILYIIALFPTWFIGKSHMTFYIFLFAALSTIFYSMPPIRLKKFTFLPNVIIALSRGLLLIVAGWSVVSDIGIITPWFIGGILGLFLLGAATTKDFSDIKGDKAYGIKTLPVVYGVKKSIVIISPFFVLPFLLLLLLTYLGFLPSGSYILYIFGLILTLWGSYIVYLMLRDSKEKSLDKNHPSWKHMYFLMIFLQVSFIAAYLV